MVNVTFTAPEVLKELLGLEADRLGISLGELITPLLAKYLKRPDLAKVKRRRAGRPRKSALQQSA